MILAIAQRELKSLFCSPFAWTVLGITQFILAWTFLAGIERFLLLQPQLAAITQAPGVTDIIITPMLSLLGILMLLMLPLLSMRLISEEYRNQTYTLLAAAPISSIQIVFGKYLSMLILILIILILPTSMCLALQTGTTLDLGQLAAGLLGISLLLATFAAIGLYFSCLTTHPGIAATCTFGTLFILWIIDAGVQDTSNQQTLDPILNWLSITQHQESFLKGMLNSQDSAYYLLLIMFCLLLSVRRLENKRLHD